MNKFEPKSIHAASEHLQNKLNVFKKVEPLVSHQDNVYIIPRKKESKLKRFMYSLFKSQ